MKTERTQIRFLSDVLVSVASLDLRACLHGVVSFFCFHALADTKQKKPTPLDRGPPRHVNRVLKSLLFSCDPTACFIMQSVVPFCRGEGRGGERQINKAYQSNADIKIGSIN